MEHGGILTTLERGGRRVSTDRRAMIGYLPAPDLLRVGLTRARVLVLYALYGASPRVESCCAT